MYQQNTKPPLPDKDMAYTILSDLKRVVREYATAATESTCPDIRVMFTNLLNSTLRLQGDLFKAMESQQMYNVASPALRQEIDKQTKQYQKDLQETNQFIQQRMGAVSNDQQQWGQHWQPQWQPIMNQPQHSMHQSYYN